MEDFLNKWIMSIASAVTLIMALGLTFLPSFPDRYYLIDQKILGDAISLFGVLSAGFIASAALLFINKRSQNYIWQRDQALKDAGDIYEPLYADMCATIREKQTARILDIKTENWHKIKDSHLGPYLKLKQPKLYEDLEYFDVNCGIYNSKVMVGINKIGKYTVEGLNRSLDAGIEINTKENMISAIKISLDFKDNLALAFLNGKSYREWLKIEYNTDQDTFVSPILVSINQKFPGHAYLNKDWVESLLNEIYARAQNDLDIKATLTWCEQFSQKANILKRELENFIIKPRLF